MDAEDVDRSTLMREVQRYLSAVETFRAEGHEPSWRVEQHLARTATPRTPELRLRVCGSSGRLDPG
jgi:hypothetical protein